jgi:hypothetical protein
MIILLSLCFVNLLQKWQGNVTWHTTIVMNPQFFLLTYMFSRIYHKILIQVFSVPLYSHILIEASYLRFLIGMSYVPVFLLPWLQTFLSRWTHGQLSNIVSEESSLPLLNSLYEVSICFKFLLQCTDIKYLMLFFCQLN